MNAIEYCLNIESKDRQHKREEANFLVKENGSKLISLLNSNCPLIYEPSIMKNYRYLVREGLVRKIERIANKLSRRNKTLVIRSAWRSFEHQNLLWEKTIARMKKKHPNKSIEEITETTSYFIAPFNKSTHATGGAVDALILDNKTNQVLDFGTNTGYIIELNKECYPHHPSISDLARKNRKLLMTLFENEGFVCDLKEYWHFDYGNIGWAIEKKKNHAFYGMVESLDDFQ